LARSKRQRKRDRAVRQAKAARKQAAAVREQLSQAVLAEAHKLLDRLCDPQTPAGDVAELLAGDGAPVVPGLVGLLVSKGATPGRLAEVTKALREAEQDDAGGAPSLTYLTFAAGAAHAGGDAPQARRLLDDALRQASDPAGRLRVIAQAQWTSESCWKRSSDSSSTRLRCSPPTASRASTHPGSATNSTWTTVCDPCQRRG